jgi:hypothetical protein
MLKTPSGRHPIKLWLLVGIILVGAFFRLYDLAEIPPGFGYDPAYYGVDAQNILQGELPIYLTTNFGREVMFSYLVALIYGAVGVGEFGIHLAAAFVGILTIPAVFLVANEFFREEKRFLRQYGGLLSALLLSLSYWHLNWSRVGLRAVLVPLFVSLVIFFLWRGLRTLRRLDFLFCGLFLGASLYTYQAARLLPLLVVMIFLFTIVIRREIDKEIIFDFLILTAATLLVYAPLGIFALTNEGALTRRLQDVVLVDPGQAFSKQIGEIIEHAKAGLLMLSFKGHSDAQYTIPGRPSLNPFLSIFFYLGLIISLWRIKNPRYLGLLVWLAIMLAPALIADQASPAKRAIGILPAVLIIIALALLAVLQRLSEWSTTNDVFTFRETGINSSNPTIRRLLVVTFSLIVVAGLLYTGVSTYRDYFLIWGKDPDLPGHFQDDRAMVATFIGQQPPDQQIYLSPLLPEHPLFQLYARDHEIQGYNGRLCTVFPSETTGDTLYVITPDENEQSLAQLKARFPQGKVIEDKPHLLRDEPYYVAYEVPAGINPQISPVYVQEAYWEDKIKLLGFDLPQPPYAPGQTLDVTLYYQVLEEIPWNYISFVHVLGDPNPATGNPVWAQADSEPCQGGYQTTAWRKDEIIVDRVPLFIPGETASGTYQLALGFYNWPDLERLQLANGGDSFLLDQPFVVR